MKMTEQISRRSFLKTAGITAAALGVTMCGRTALAAAYQPPFEKPSFATKGEKMSDRTLITYGTKAGSTAEVAARMGEILGKRGLPVDVKPLEAVVDLAPYRSVILGSAVRMGKVLPEALKFVEKNQAALGQKQFSIFIVCLTLREDTPEKREKASGFLDPVRALVKPTREGLFAGKVDLNKLTLFDRTMANMVKLSVGDFRKWDLINAWAESLPA
jgi:menaquinone-dependent protoporphyrinogen oxidase